MNNSLHIQSLRSIRKGRFVPVVPLWHAGKLVKKKNQKVSLEGVKKELPHFYTKPIFKAKKHDFL